MTFNSICPDLCRGRDAKYLIHIDNIVLHPRTGYLGNNLSPIQNLVFENGQSEIQNKRPMKKRKRRKMEEKRTIKHPDRYLVDI